jgi:hypothetical protein
MRHSKSYDEALARALPPEVVFAAHTMIKGVILANALPLWGAARVGRGLLHVLEAMASASQPQPRRRRRLRPR